MKPTRRDEAPQDELPLKAGLEPHALFPGRVTLYVFEVAEVLRCTDQHVINLILDYEATGGAMGMKGVSIARNLAPGAKPPRGCWRVTVADFDTYCARLRESHLAAS